MNKPTAIIIPLYRYSQHLETVLQGCLRHFPADRILVVDDGSPDLASARAQKYGVHVLRYPVNRGKGAALRAGIDFWRERKISWVITLDSDGQHDVADLPAFISAIAAGEADVILGWRKNRSAMPVDRRISNTLTSWIISRLARTSIPDSQCGYRALKTDLLPGHRWFEDGFFFESEFLLKCAGNACQIKYIPVRTIYHPGDVSSIRRFPDTARFIRLVIRRITGRD